MAKELCAGSLAVWYEAEGGAVQWHGKPFADVYRVARAAMGLQRQQVLAIGDSFTTDVAGARAAGIDVLLVNTGIHQADLGMIYSWVERLSREKVLAEFRRSPVPFLNPESVVLCEKSVEASVKLFYFLFIMRYVQDFQDGR